MANQYINCVCFVEVMGGIIKTKADFIKRQFSICARIVFFENFDPMPSILY